MWVSSYALQPSVGAGGSDRSGRSRGSRRLEREGLRACTAVDLAQAVDATSEVGLAQESHALERGDHTYVPFRVTMDAVADNSKPTAMYARAASRRDGVRASEYDSYRVDGAACSTA